MPPPTKWRGHKSSGGGPNEKSPLTNRDAPYSRVRGVFRRGALRSKGSGRKETVFEQRHGRGVAYSVHFPRLPRVGAMQNKT